MNALFAKSGCSKTEEYTAALVESISNSGELGAVLTTYRFCEGAHAEIKNLLERGDRVTFKGEETIAKEALGKTIEGIDMGKVNLEPAGSWKKRAVKYGPYAASVVLGPVIMAGLNWYLKDSDMDEQNRQMLSVLVGSLVTAIGMGGTYEYKTGYLQNKWKNYRAKATPDQVTPNDEETPKDGEYFGGAYGGDMSYMGATSFEQVCLMMIIVCIVLLVYILWKGCLQPYYEGPCTCKTAAASAPEASASTAW